MKTIQNLKIKEEPSCRDNWLATGRKQADTKINPRWSADLSIKIKYNSGGKFGRMFLSSWIGVGVEG